MTYRLFAAFCSVVVWLGTAGCGNDGEKPTGPHAPPAPASLIGSWQSVSFDTGGVSVPDDIIVLTFESDSTLGVVHCAESGAESGAFRWDVSGSTLTLTAIDGTFLATSLEYSFGAGPLTLTGQTDATGADFAITLRSYAPLPRDLHRLWVKVTSGASPYEVETHLFLPDNTGIKLTVGWEARQEGDAIVFSSMFTMTNEIYTWSADDSLVYFVNPYYDHDRAYILTDSTLVWYPYPYTSYQASIYTGAETELDWGDNGGPVVKIGPATTTSLDLKDTNYYFIVDEIYAVWFAPAAGGGIDISVLGNPVETSAVVVPRE